MRKLNIVVIDKQAAKGSKYKLFVDRHYAALLQELLKLGYDAEMVPEFETVDQSIDKDLKDFETHKWLCEKRKKIKEKPIIFITNNYKDFCQLNTPKRTYHIFDVNGQRDLQKILNKIQHSLQDPHKDLGDGLSTTLSVGEPIRKYKNQDYVLKLARRSVR